MNSSMRIGVLGLVFAALLSLLVLRLWTMQVTEAQAYEEQALRNQVRVVVTPAPRGDVFDRNHVKLAGTVSALSAVVDLALVDSSDREALAQNLAAFLDLPASQILEDFDEESQGGLFTAATNLTEGQATFIAEHREEFPGVNIIPQPVRIYPEGEIAAHVLGYIGRPTDEDLEREDVNGNDYVGKAGVERSYDAVLRGDEGVIEYQVDAKRKVLSLASEQAPTSGGSLVLTIDAALQAQLQDSLRDGLIQARLLEGEERVEAIADQPLQDRLNEALQAARQEAATPDDAEDDGEESSTTVTEDVRRNIAEITVDPATVLASLYPGLPIDTDGVCVPVERVTVAEGESGLLSGKRPRRIAVNSIDEVDGEFVASVTVGPVGSEQELVETNTSFAGTAQVLAITEDEVVVYHRDKWCPVRSVGVIEDPNDGSILAMASYPAYDPADFVDGLSQEQWASLGTVSAFQNFAVQGLYAPASTYKAVPYVLALEEDFYPIDRGVGDKAVGDEEVDGEEGGGDDGATPIDGDDGQEPDADPVAPEVEADQLPLLTDTDEYSCSGEFKFTLNDGTVQTKRDWKWPQGHGPLDLHGALQASCDLYFWDIGLRLWNERGDDSGVDKENLLQEYSRELGFGTATGIDLPFERNGLVPDRAWFREEQKNETGRVRTDGSWVGGDLMDIAVGQGAILSTPLQLANGYAALVNGGTVWQPRVVQEVIDGDGTVIQKNTATVLNTVEISDRTVRLLRNDLQQVVNNQERGTARSAFANFGENVALVGGKTGTGEVIKAPRSERFRQVDNAFFVGVAPITAPEYVIAIVVERGGSGGRVAAPIARQLLQYVLNGPEGVTELAPGLDAD